MKIEALELASSPFARLQKTPVSRLREATARAGVVHRAALPAKASQPNDYRWTIAIATTRVGEPAARVFCEALAWAWPDEALDLALLRFAEDGAKDEESLAELRAHPFDLLFVLDDPGAPDEIAAFLSLARSARQIPILLADPCAAPNRRLPALSLPVYPTGLDRFAWEFAMSGMFPLMASGLVCIDWQDVLKLLDVEGGIGSLLHVEAASFDEAGQCLREAVEARLACAPPGHKVYGMQTTLCASGPRMAQVRACVQSLRGALPQTEDPFFIYAVPLITAERCHLFGMLLFLPVRQS